MKKTIIFNLCVVVLFLLVGCSNNREPHVHDYEEKYVEPTCTEEGYKKCACSCGAIMSYEWEEPRGHEYRNRVCTVCNEELIPNQGFEYELSDDGTYYTIVGMGTCPDEKYICIPATYNDLPIKVIGSGAIDGEKIEYIFFEENSQVTTFESNSFSAIWYLKSIVFPESLTSIGSLSFQGRQHLEEVYITKNVSKIGDRAFFGCEGLKKITVDERNMHFKSVDDILYTKDGKKLIQYNLASENSSFIVPQGVEYIGSGAFANANSLIEVTLPDTVVSIYGEAFRWCEELVSIRMSATLETIASFAFDRCVKLQNIYIPTATRTIWGDSFRGCRSLEFIEVEADNAYFQAIDASLYTKDGRTLMQYALGRKNNTFEVPSHVETIGTSAFKGCANIKNITMGDNVTVIGEDAFSGCEKLEHVELPSSLKTIGEGAFSHCPALNNVDLPSSVEKIEHYAFAHCVSLESITIPAGCVEIGDLAFNGCHALTEAIFENSSGWWAAAQIDSVDLENTSWAAMKLSGEYSQYTWTCNKEGN